MTDLPTLSDLHPHEIHTAAFAQTCENYRREVESHTREVGLSDGAISELQLGCVVRLDRGFPAVMTAGGAVRAEFAARLTKGDFSRVAVGDWVCVRVPHDHEMALIQEILPRTSDVARWRGGTRGERQTLAANVDVVVVVAALGGSNFSAQRIARAVVVARDCGCEAAVVLTKADRVGAGGAVSAVHTLHEVLGVGVQIVVTCAGSQEDTDVSELQAAVQNAGAHYGLESVRSLTSAGSVAIVLGESGAGKSTLLNALLGHELLQTGAVRATDDAGRHTTVARRMVALPDGGIIVDEPGLRSLPLVGHERGLGLVFPAIAQAAQNCRFRDCTHTHEPGCAVRAAQARHRFSEAALACYLGLAAEMRTSAATLDPDVVL